MFAQESVMDIQKEREAFEKHASKFFTDSKEAFKTNGDQYLYDEVIWMWDCWIERAKAQAVPKWISVKDNLPPANILVLGMSQTRSNIFNIYNVMALDEFEEADVTHWMPLPDAPQEPAND
jgi:hypothetical protein